MKKFLLLLIMSYVVTGFILAQKDNYETDVVLCNQIVKVIKETLQTQQENDSSDFEKNVALLKSGRFVIKGKTLYSQDENRYFTVNPQCNFLIMDDNDAKLQVTNNEHIGFYEHHKVSDVNISYTKKGDVLLTAFLKDSRKAIRLKIKLHKGTNNCEAVFSSAKRSGNYTLIGEINSGSISDVLKLY